MCPDELRQFRVLQFCHVHGHDLACSNKREGERERGGKRGETVRLFVFVLSAVEGEISRVWQGAVTIDTDDAAGTRRGSDHVRR